MSIGQHVTLITADGKAFSGILNAIDDQAGKVVLKNVLADGCRLPDLQTFFASDIKDLAFTEGSGTRDNGSDFLSDHVKRVRGKFVARKDVRSQLSRAPIFNGDRLLLSHIAGDDVIDQGIGSGEDGDNFEDYYETDDYLLLCRPCEKFREVIVYLMEQECAAAVFHGVEIGRKGALSLLQIATEEYIFLFDILRLGLEGFNEGLQEVLESKDVMKIVHDCRMVSDLLYHQYDVVLSNVFDTQVAGAFAYRDCNGGDWPRSVESLPRALMQHLDIPEEDVHFAFVRERSRKMDEEIWLQRPLSKQLLLSTLKNVRKLIPLYQYMWQKLMMPFKVGVEIYLDQVRDAPEGVAVKQKISGHLLPHAFQDLEKRTSSFSREFTFSRMRNTSYDHKGFKENIVCPGRQRSKVVASRDAIWHTTKQLFPTSRTKGTQPKASAGGPPEIMRRRNNTPQKSTLPIKTFKNEDSESLPRRNVSNRGGHDSPIGNQADQDSKDTSGALFAQSPSTAVLPKSSTPNTNGSVPSPSSEVFRSALFRLNDSLSPSSHSKLSVSDDRVGKTCPDSISKSPMAAPVLDQSATARSRQEVYSNNENKKLRWDNSLEKSQEYFNLSSVIEEKSTKASQQACSSETSQLEDESNLVHYQRRSADVSSERSFDEMNLIPAGLHMRQKGKKQTKRIQEEIQQNVRKDKQVSSMQTTGAHIADLQEDLGTIPMHSSLQRSKTEPQSGLRNIEYCMEDPCDVGTSVNSLPSNSKSVLSRLNLPQCQRVVVPLSVAEDDEVEESLVNEILKLEEVQKILRQMKLEKPSSNIRSKLLSSKIKL